ncbi:basic salivary proline-rich protein 3 isoform X2 [Gouania willdenowi]|uniref:basic salivary proline-rich protein 3 isoform X2 n=1 Tax=Gouania willdenowi TaxID=441366 RepID=UPI0010546C57|nr:basic salivary proline-rich protein 3-like isoform X2 [Gouania willdenowi]
MDSDTKEKSTEIPKSSKVESENPVIETKSSRGRGVRGGGRGWGALRGGGHGGRGVIKSFGPPGHVRGRGTNGAMNGFLPIRGTGRMQPYPDFGGHRGRGGPWGMGPPPPPPPLHFRGPFPPPPRHRPPTPPPLRHPGFMRRPPHPLGLGMPPSGPPRLFHPFGPRGRRQ